MVVRSEIEAAAERADQVLVITRVFDAPRALVFKLWTDSNHARKWWGPRDYPATSLQMDVRPGGVWRCCLRSTETGKELWQGGVFREVAGERSRKTLVTVIFAEQDGKTLMTFRHAPFQSSEERNGHQGGWTRTFDRLVDYLKDL